MGKLTAARLREVVHYDPSTGIFTRIEAGPRSPAGSEPGYLRGDGYRAIRIDSVKYLAHRLAWLYVFGEWPGEWLDHIDRDRGNNRIANLRDVSPRENNFNLPSRPGSSSRFVGVKFRKDRNRWTARISVNGKQINLGCFATEEEANAAYLRAKPHYHHYSNYRASKEAGEVCHRQA
ncbi:HNH endonuclease signature motif containing protein [Neorhizobium sp. DT-125]|uniref:HNH endonuclease signature motif containing protein n=1 Tax=Neorhizobium sp. DT-125 TaxID=3396163 RepID=UPI003F1E1823